MNLWNLTVTELSSLLLCVLERRCNDVSPLLFLHLRVAAEGFSFFFPSSIINVRRLSTILIKNPRKTSVCGESLERKRWLTQPATHWSPKIRRNYRVWHQKSTSNCCEYFFWKSRNIFCPKKLLVAFRDYKNRIWPNNLQPQPLVLHFPTSLCFDWKSFS